MTPIPHRVLDVVHETRETVTLTLEPVSDAVPAPAAGQFTMLWAWGAGEVPISVSALAPDGRLVHTIRDVAGVTKTLCASRPGDVLGVRGPYGRGGRSTRRAADLVLVAGGIGLAPLRPSCTPCSPTAPRSAASSSSSARAPSRSCSSAASSTAGGTPRRSSCTIVDRPRRAGPAASASVTGEPVGLDLDTARTRVMVCGPEVMMRVVAQHVTDRGVPASQVEVSLERNMQCAVKTCGHCQVGPYFACTDGPVLSWDVVDPLLTVREL
jgi:NAD(P)H-flavin reductase